MFPLRLQAQSHSPLFIGLEFTDPSVYLPPVSYTGLSFLNHTQNELLSDSMDLLKQELPFLKTKTKERNHLCEGLQKCSETIQSSFQPLRFKKLQVEFLGLLFEDKPKIFFFSQRVGHWSRVVKGDLVSNQPADITVTRGPMDLHVSHHGGGHSLS